MKLSTKKMACVALAFSMIASLTACKKDSKKKESTGFTAAAEEALDCAISLNSKKIKKLDKNYGVDGVQLSYLYAISDNDMVKAVMEKASFEIDEDTVKEKKKSASCEATVKLPDYEEAYDEADGDEDAFIEEIDAQKEKKYKEISVKLVFDVDDEEYTWKNAEDVLDELYGDLLEVIDFDPLILETDETLTPPDTKPTDDTETPPDTKPTDDTQTPPDTQSTDDTLPTDDTKPTETGETAPLRDVKAKKVDLNQESFEAVLKAVDPEAAKDVTFIDMSSELNGAKTVKLGSAYSHSFKVSYIYYEFETEDMAKKYFSDSTSSMQKYCTSYQVEDDWGYVSYQMAGFTVGSYYSGKYYFTINVLDESAECVDIVPNIIEALCK